MKNWNVIITVFQDGFRCALRVLRELGPIERSPYHNVLVMKVSDPIALLAASESKIEQSAALYDAIFRVAPPLRIFEFQSKIKVLDEAKRMVRDWSQEMNGWPFHVRLHRRGTKHNLGTQDTEHKLNDAVIEATQKTGVPAKISFTDPDAVIAIDTIDERAGMSLWTREDMARHRLLRPD